MEHSLTNAARLITSTLSLRVEPDQTLRQVQATGEIDWGQLAGHADAHSLTPLLYDTWRQAGALAFVPPAIRSRLAQAFADNHQRNRFIRQELVDIHTLLNRAGVPHLVLKGWPLAERLYDHPAHRVLYDHDFLVPAPYAETGQQALLEAGFTPLPNSDAWIEKHLPSLWRNGGYRWNGYLFDPHYPRPVELHLRLWEDGWRGLCVRQMAHLWATAQTCLVAGQPMQTLGNEETLVHLTTHFAGHLVEREARLSQLLDVARFMDRTPLLDWERIWALADQAGVTRFVYAALWLAHRIFAAPLPPEHLWRRLAVAVPPAFRRWLAGQGEADVLTSDYRRRRRGMDYRLTFLAAASLRERLGVVRFALLPPLAHLQARYRLPHRWLAVGYYPRYLLERTALYARSMIQ